MKLALCIAAAVLGLTTSLRADEVLITTYSSGTLNQAIPDGNPTGAFWEIQVDGLSADQSVFDVKVTLNLAGGYNGDLYAYLTFGDYLAVLLNRVGKTSGNAFGYGDAGFEIVLDSAAAGDIHLYRETPNWSITGGAAWQPDGRNADPFNVTDETPRAASLDVFAGVQPNGTWTLFVADMAGGDASSSELVNWSIQIYSVPEPSSLVLSLLGGFGLLAMFRRRR